ncbi:MAG: lasso peptide biosynthesis B2 protein [Vicinamibacterales bacterium]
MPRLASLLSMQRADRVLIAHALALHVAVAAGVRLVSPRRLLRWLHACYGERPQRGSGARADQADRIAGAVRTATRVLPIGRTCLTEALTAQCLLRRSGHDATLRIGVARGDPGGAPLRAHAWLVSAGRIVVGDWSGPTYLALGRGGEEA